jgi:NAD(P)-dependent dehydrogenase (short-subunit alcohol dehydrogenase family)
VAALEQDGHGAEAVHADLADRAATLELGRSVGAVDILVNNAAPGQTNAPFVQIPDTEWDLQFAVIMWAPLILTREIGGAMAERGGGSIVNILSAAIRGPAPLMAPYAAAKAALEIIARCTALELGPRGVRANGVAPTFVPTERNRAIWERVGFTENSGRSNPSGRVAAPADIAGTVGWLCTDAAGYVNGQTIVRGHDRLQLDQDVRECLVLTMAMTVLGGATAPTPDARSKAVIDTLVERVALAVDDLEVARLQ